MFRAEFGWDLYTRMCVPVEEHLTRVWYYHCTRPKNALGARLGPRCCTAPMRRWIIEYNFSRQDERVMLNQRYDTPEKLSGTDAEVIQWRRLVVTKQHRRPQCAVRVQATPTAWPRTRCPLEPRLGALPPGAGARAGRTGRAHGAAP